MIFFANCFYEWDHFVSENAERMLMGFSERSLETNFHLERALFEGKRENPQAGLRICTLDEFMKAFSLVIEERTKYGRETVNEFLLAFRKIHDRQRLVNMEFAASYCQPGLDLYPFLGDCE